MAPRRASIRSSPSAPAARQRAPAGIPKNARSQHALNRYGQRLHPAPSTRGIAETPEPVSSVEPGPSIPEYTHCTDSYHIENSSLPVSPNNPRQQTRTPTAESEPEPHTPSSTTSDLPIDLSTIRDLVRSQDDIVDRVVLRLHSQNPAPTMAITPNAKLEAECNDPTIGSYNHYHLSPNGIPRGNQWWYGLVYFIQIAGKPRIRPRQLLSSLEVLY